MDIKGEIEIKEESVYPEEPMFNQDTKMSSNDLVIHTGILKSEEIETVEGKVADSSELLSTFNGKIDDSQMEHTLNENHEINGALSKPEKCPSKSKGKGQSKGKKRKRKEDAKKKDFSIFCLGTNIADYSGVNVHSIGTIFETLFKTHPCQLSGEEICELNARRPTPKLSIIEGRDKRNFQTSWYDRFPWLTGCDARNKMFCFRCMMFGSSSSEWCTVGMSDLKNFIRKAVKHATSKQHLLNEERFKMLLHSRFNHDCSEASRLEAIKHNQKVSLNRQVLERLIQAVIFLSKQEIAFRDHRDDEDSANKGNYLALLDFMAQKESLIRDHLNSCSLFKGTCPDIQNDLIDAITCVLNEKIRTEIEESPFISFQIDETLDVSCKNQISFIFRYTVKDRIEERFVGFYDVSKARTGLGLTEIICNVMEKWGINANKVVSQSYDGAVMMADPERGLQRLEHQIFCPHVYFIHCYAHHLNLVLLHGSRQIKQVKLFICALSAFYTFFSKSSKRAILLNEREKSFQSSNTNEAHLNFHSRAVSTILKCYSELYRIFDDIIKDTDYQWDSETIHCAIGLKRNMDDPEFLFLLHVFQACFDRTNPLFKVLQSPSLSILSCQNEVNLAIYNIDTLRSESFVEECVAKSTLLNESLVYSNELKTYLVVLVNEILDYHIAHMKLRFADLLNFKFIELVNEENFVNYKKSFVKVKENIDQLVNNYPFFVREQLENELSNIYADKEKYLPPHELLQFFVNTGLDTVYVEVTKLLRLILTLPISRASCETNTLKRMKTYLRNSMANNSLSDFCSLAVEKNLLDELSSDPSFLEKAINKFAFNKKRNFELVYKKIR